MTITERLLCGREFFLLLTFLLLSCTVAFPQTESKSNSAESQTSALARWISLEAPPGWEHLAIEPLSKILTGWTIDSAGNLMLRKGNGSPRRVVACGLDRAGFAVTEITENGYLRLREAGALRQHPLWDQFHEGQRIKVLTRSGNVPGVVAVRSTHLQRGRSTPQPTTVDDLWVDVGARSRLEVERMRIQILDPVVREFPEWSFGKFVAGPSAGMRVGCAAVATAAQSEITSGETIFLLTTLRNFGNDGLEASLRKLGRIDQLFLIDQIASTGSRTDEGAMQLMIQKPTFLPETAGITSAMTMSPEVRFAGSLVETVELQDADAFLRAIKRVAGASSSSGPNENWVSPPRSMSAKSSKPVDAYDATAGLLSSFADVPGVSGHEAEIRLAILSALPAALRSRVITDDAGNLILELGPDHGPVMFIAHQDEVGFEITSIAEDGSVALRNRGGLYSSLWEGQPALLHIDRQRGDNTLKAPLRGVFVPRGNATSKQPESIVAWFGLNAAELKDHGVRIGQSVTSYKKAVRIGPTRFTARALDDRTGTTALILAARRINPALLKRKVIFAWSVREETGLEGARVLAQRYAKQLSSVYSIDTFVSSDSPLESTRFAFTPLGQGAVIRGLDNASVSTPGDIDKIVDLARRLAIPLQIGATNGGADGSEFVRYGVPHVGLSWPGRYSHSPVEVLDLRDVQSLERLIYALATAP